MMFAMPDTLPADTPELQVLADSARREVHGYQVRANAGEELSEADVDRLEYLLDGFGAIQVALKAAAGEALTAAGKSKRRVSVPEFDLAVAAHEAAHAVLTALHGGQVFRAEVLAVSRPVAGSNGLDVRGYCRRDHNFVVEQSRHLVAAAGPAAEAVARFGSSPTHAQIEDVLRGNGSDLAAIRAQRDTFGDSVRVVGSVVPTVLRCWGPISVLAVKMVDKGPISHGDVTAALGLSENQGAHSFELAAIRSGLRSVPKPKGCGGVT